MMPMVQLLRRRENRLAGASVIASASVIATVGLFIAGNALRGATPTGLILPHDLTVLDGWWIRLNPLYSRSRAPPARAPG
jgi:hypothetical protein